MIMMKKTMMRRIMYNNYVRANYRKEDEWTGDIPSFIPRTTVESVLVLNARNRQNAQLGVFSVLIVMILVFLGIIALIRRKNE